MTEYIYIYIYIYQSILKMGLANFNWILSVFCNYDTTPLYQQNSTFIYPTEKLIDQINSCARLTKSCERLSISCARVSKSCTQHKIFHLHVPLGSPYETARDFDLKCNLP